jgi:hypothetical protein
MMEPPGTKETVMDAEQDDNNNRRPIAMVVGGVVAVAAIVVGFLLLTDDGDEVDTTSTTTTGETTTTETTTTPEETTTTVFAPTVDPSVPIFPDPGTSQRFDDPVAVTTAWVTDVVGFRDPVVGAFQQGDSRSGEVEVRGFADGAPTVVLVRQLEDDTWFVIGATTDSIRVTDPEAGATITSPQPLVGAAYAFEGVVDVRLYADGDTEPIAESFVMGRGDGVLGDFSDTIEFTAPDGAAFGVLVFSEASAEDGSAVYATAFRVAL